jgi:ATP-dependent DNA ligase
LSDNRRVAARPTLRPIELMIPALARPFYRPGSIFEEKLDGWRIVAYKNGDRVRLVSRTGRDHARTPGTGSAGTGALAGCLML